MCCCHQRHHSRHLECHHHSEPRGCGSHTMSCDEAGHQDAQKARQVLEHLQTRVQAVEERLATLEEA